MTPELRPLQVDHYNRIKQARAAGKRIIIVQGATGYGKNTLAAYIVRQCADKGMRALAMVHRRKLVDQISERLQQFEVQHGILMRGERVETDYRIQVASRDTLLSRCVRNEWVGLPPADLVIVDEAHHAADPESEYRRILGKYPNATILLLSATPVGPDGRGLGPWAEAIVCAAPVSQLVREGYLVGLKCYAPARKRKGKKFLRGIAGDLVESWKDYGEDMATALFTNRVKHSRDAVAAFLEAGIPAAHVDADTDDYERNKIFDGIVSGKIKILSNVGILGEGVDIPELGCCQLYCECGSRTGLLQRAGRVMRSFPGKTHGVLIDHSGAVFRHGFPDEDMEWTLEGNADENFAKKHAAGETEKAFYCKRCELAYHGQEACPQCGRAPAKPPRSIFAPPPVRPRNELLMEAERGQKGHSREEKIAHWFRCLNVAKKRNGTFTMASAIFKQKYQEWPSSDFPMLPDWNQRREKVADVYPDFGRRKAQ